MADSYIQAAFDKICQEATMTKGYYVTLMEDAPFYGGPEEGGWWGHDHIVKAFQYFNNKQAAEAARDKIEDLAKDLSEQSRREFGEHCLRQMEWLDARGLDADYLPEPDGESNFYVTITEGLPEDSYGSRGYE